MLVGQAGGPTSVINASLVGVIREARAAGYDRVVGMRNGVHGLLVGDLIDLTAQPEPVLQLVSRTPSAALGATRRRPNEDEIASALVELRSLGVSALLYIGGNDSADTLHRIGSAGRAAGCELSCIHVPKTIDNDLVLTDHTPGYGSAARHIATLARDAGRDTEAMRHTDPVKLLEVPGRNSGWLSAAAALARERTGDAPHLIVPPETRIDLTDLLGRVEGALSAYGCAVVVVAETARGVDGHPVGTDDPTMGETDAFGHRRLSGAAAYLCSVVAERLHVRARWEKPGTLVRTSGLCLSEIDLSEAELVGRTAVRAAAHGETDVMVTLVRDPGPSYRCSTGLAPLSEVANRERSMPPAFISDGGFDVTEAFLSYARPLIGPPLPPYGRFELVRPGPR